MKKILGALQDLLANQHSQSSHNVELGWIGCASQLVYPALYHRWGVKNDLAYVLQFFSLISDGLGGVKHDRLRLYQLFRNISNYTISLNSDGTNAIAGKRKNAGHVLYSYFCIWLANFIAKICGEVNFMQQTIQPNFLLFDFTANAACYVCCKLILTFVQFLQFYVISKNEAATWRMSYFNIRIL